MHRNTAENNFFQSFMRSTYCLYFATHKETATISTGSGVFIATQFKEGEIFESSHVRRVSPTAHVELAYKQHLVSTLSSVSFFIHNSPAK